MTDLKEQVLKALEFDVAFATEDAKEPWNANPSDCHFVGMRHEHERLSPLLTALADVASAADRYTDADAEDYHTSCTSELQIALASLRKVLGEK